MIWKTIAWTFFFAFVAGLIATMIYGFTYVSAPPEIICDIVSHVVEDETRTLLISMPIIGLFITGVVVTCIASDQV